MTSGMCELDEMKYTKKRLQVPVRDGPFLRGGGEGGRGNWAITKKEEEKKNRREQKVHK